MLPGHLHELEITVANPKAGKVRRRATEFQHEPLAPRRRQRREPCRAIAKVIALMPASTSVPPVSGTPHTLAAVPGTSPSNLALQSVVCQRRPGPGQPLPNEILNCCDRAQADP